MKSTFLRVMTLLVALAMVLCCFSSCSTKGNDEEAVLDENVSGTNTVTDQDVENADPEKVENSDADVVGPDESEDEEPADDENKDDEPADDENEPADDENKDDEGKEDNKEDEDYSDLFEDEKKDYSNHFVVASYNVQNFQGSNKEEYEGIAKEINDVGAVVVGLQELDYMNNRSGKQDQVKVLAELAGFEYTAFTPAHNANYGTGVISKYPIKSHEVFHYEHQDGEERSFSRSVIDMDGKIMNFYNTHLCLGGSKHTAKQMAEVFACIKKNNDKNVVITGDMNCRPEAFMELFSTDDFIPLNGGDTFLACRNTHPDGDKPTSPIDNIIVSTDWDYYMEEDTTIGILVSYSQWSDHNMCYTYLKFKD